MKLMARANHRAEQGDQESNGLRRALDRSYDRLRQRAQAEWERYYGMGDPADACVSVRVENGERPLLA